MSGVDKDQEREMIAAPDWGDDIDPKVETAIEHVHKWCPRQLS